MRKVILIAVTLFFASGVVAQETPTTTVRLTNAVALARLCISEANWDCFMSGDGVAIHEVISWGADRQGIRYTSYARAYAGRLFGARPHDNARLRWVGQLNEACTEPADWPEVITTNRRGVVTVQQHPAWSNFRARCLAVMARARQVVAEMSFDNVDEWGICARPVHDWGGWMDRDRAERLGLVPVPCNVGPDEQTHNDFYCRPSVDPTCVEVDVD